jgi:hypothetical protein
LAPHEAEATPGQARVDTEDEHKPLRERPIDPNRCSVTLPVLRDKASNDAPRRCSAIPDTRQG